MSKTALETTKAKPVTARDVFRDIKPFTSKNVEVDFKDALKIPRGTRMDGTYKPLKGRRAMYVEHDSEFFAVPYTTLTTPQKAEASLAGALKTRKFKIYRLGAKA